MKPGDMINVRVSTKASRNEVKLEQNQDGTLEARVYVTVVPEDNKANKAVIQLLAKALDIRPSALEIISGHKSRDKRIVIKPF